MMEVPALEVGGPPTTVVSQESSGTAVSGAGVPSDAQQAGAEIDHLISDAESSKVAEEPEANRPQNQLPNQILLQIHLS